MQTASQSNRLKLRGRDREDFAVLSAVLQDALAPVRDMTFIAKEKRFAMVVNRFRWEARAPLEDLPDQPRPDIPEREGDARFEDAPLYERVHCGVTFDRVEGAYYTGFFRSESERILNLLAVVGDSKGVTLHFSDDAAVRLRGARVVCHLEDLGEPWPTRWRPSHEEAAEAPKESSAWRDMAEPETAETRSPETRTADSGAAETGTKDVDSEKK